MTQRKALALKHDLPLLMMRLQKRNYSLKTILKKTIEEAGKFMVDSVRASFLKSQDPEGAAWEKPHYPVPYRPMLDGIIRIGKCKITKSAKPLINYGNLMKGVTHYVTPDKMRARIGYGNWDALNKGFTAHYADEEQTLHIEDVSGRIRHVEWHPIQRKALGFANWPRFAPVNDRQYIRDLYAFAIRIGWRRA